MNFDHASLTLLEAKGISISPEPLGDHTARCRACTWRRTFGTLGGAVHRSMEHLREKHGIKVVLPRSQPPNVAAEAEAAPQKRTGFGVESSRDQRERVTPTRRIPPLGVLLLLAGLGALSAPIPPARRPEVEPKP